MGGREEITTLESIDTFSNTYILSTFALQRDVINDFMGEERQNDGRGTRAVVTDLKDGDSPQSMTSSGCG